MVEIEMVANTALNTAHKAENEVEKAAKSATSENQQDPGEQAAREMERTAKVALRCGERAVTHTLANGWGSAHASKDKEITEDINV